MEREKDAAVPAVEREGALLVWQVFGAPGLTIGLLGAMLALLLVGTQIPQGIPDAALGEGHSFSVWRTAEGFGLARIATSWPMLLLAVLLVLNVAGLWLRRRFVPPSERLPLEGSRVRAEVVEVSVEGGDALARSLGRWFSATRVVLRPGLVEARRGRAREARIVIVLALGVLAAAGAVHAFGGQEGRIVTRLSPPAGMEPRDVTQVQRLGVHTWEPGGPALEVACQPSPDAGPDAFACAFAGEGAHTTLLVKPGRPAWLPGLQITLERAELVRELEGVRLVLINEATGEEAPMSAAPGQMYDVGVAVPGGEAALTLVGVHGVEGPVAAVSADTGAVVFAGVGVDAVAAGAPVRVRGDVDRRLVLRYTTTAHRPVAMAGAVLLLLGLLMLALPGHMEVVARELAPGRWTVRATSLDRPEQARALVRALAAPTGEVTA